MHGKLQDFGLHWRTSKPWTIFSISWFDAKIDQPGWWLGPWFVFPSIGKFIIPTNFHICHMMSHGNGKSPNEWKYSIRKIADIHPYAGAIGPRKWLESAFRLGRAMQNDVQLLNINQWIYVSAFWKTSGFSTILCSFVCMNGGCLSSIMWPFFCVAFHSKRSAYYGFLPVASNWFCFCTNLHPTPPYNLVCTFVGS